MFSPMNTQNMMLLSSSDSLSVLQRFPSLSSPPYHVLLSSFFYSLSSFFLFFFIILSVAPPHILIQRLFQGEN